MNFQTIKTAISNQFAKLTATGQLYRVAVNKDQLWNTYLESFPDGTNPIYKTRTQHDCNCCKQFIRAVGDVVAIHDGKVISLWDCKVNDDAYQIVVDAMSKLIHQSKIENEFLHFEPTAGTNKTFIADLENHVKAWDHFFVNIPSTYVVKIADIPSLLNESRTNKELLESSLAAIDQESIDIVLELISQNSIYRGSEHTFAITEFRKVLKAYKKTSNKEAYLWQASMVLPASVSRMKNTVIGTLLTDITSGMDIEGAVKSFEAKVAPANYKRPTALVTKKMIDAAKKTVEELGLNSALERRYANINDITINNILFADRSAKKAILGDVFDVLSSGVALNKKTFDKVEEISIEKFLADILPKATSLEVMVENRHQSNLVSLVAPVDATAKNMFKWDNKFSWSYNGDMADSIKERVKKAGGNVTGELCCRLAWEYKDDLDFHMHEPDGGHIYYATRGRASPCGGKLDVDANGCSGMMEHPVENIFYEKLATMKNGVYELKVHNFSRRSDGIGFEVEVDLLGQVYSFVYPKVIKSGESITVATITKDKTGVKVNPVIESTQTSKKVWNIDTNNFHKVSVVMHSPNYWDEKAVGNKHYFFMLEGCQNDGKARGFFNEFLSPELDKHRKVLEMVGSKMKTEESEHQLSGLGFSSTMQNSVLVKVSGAVTRTLKVVF
jgi:hypothetical protein